MSLLLLSVCVFVVSGLAAVFAQRSARLATGLGVTGAVAGATIGLIPSLRVLLGGETESLRVAWQVPYGAFFVEIDPLSAWFLLPILGLSAVAAIYGAEYLMAYRDKKKLGAPWFFFNLLAASMVMVVVARNGVLFLVSWEVMSLASFFLVTFEDEEEKVREAGWTYLVATHLGTAFLLALFVLLGREAGSLDFDQFGAAGALAPATASLLFVLAIIGFGTKAGFMPFHVWLPEAHPAAPSHVSAVMSGVMIKTGIYGILRTLTFLGTPPPWWGWLLIGIGLTSGIFGVLFALAQRHLKRLLAYRRGLLATAIRESNTKSEQSERRVRACRSRFPVHNRRLWACPRIGRSTNHFSGCTQKTTGLGSSASAAAKTARREEGAAVRVVRTATSSRRWLRGVSKHALTAVVRVGVAVSETATQRESSVWRRSRIGCSRADPL